MLAVVDTKPAVTHLGALSSVVQLGSLTQLQAAYLIDRRNKTAEKAWQLFAYNHLVPESSLPSLNISLCFKHKEDEDLPVKAPNLRGES